MNITKIFNKWTGLRCWSQIPCGSPITGKILFNNHKDIMVNTHNNYLPGQANVNLIYTNHSRVTWLSKQKEEDEDYFGPD